MDMVKSFLTIFLFFTIATFHTHAQLEKLDYEQLLLGETANQNTVMAILQDQQGFMWFGTREGLYRYDGYQLRTFKHEYGNPNSITNNEIRNLMEDSKGNIWITTVYGGINVYNPKSDTFNSYQYDPQGKQTLSHNNTTAIYEDTDGIIWIGTYGGGLNRLDPKTGLFTVYKFEKNNPNSLGQDYISAIIEGSDGFLWIGLSGYGIDRFDKSKGTFTNYHIQFDDPNKTFRSNVIRKLYDDGDGNIWAATYYGLNKLHKASGDFKHWGQDASKGNGDKSLSLHGIAKGEKTSLWLSSYGNGIHEFDLQKEEFVFVPEIHQNTKNLFAIARDQTGILWLGTDHNGVYRYYDTPKFGFVSLPGLQSYISRIFMDKKGNKWFGTMGQGIYRINDTNEILIFNTDNGLSQNIVQDIAQDTNGDLWIATNGAGLNHFSPTTNTIYTYRYQHGNPKSLFHDSVFTTYMDPQGNFWVGTAAGLSFFDKTANQFTRLESSGEVWDILQVDRQLWVGTNNGLLIYGTDKNGHIIKPTEPTIIKTNGLLHFKVNCIFKNNDNEIFVGTNEGLNQYDPITNRFIDLNELYKMPYAKVTAMTQDQYHDYWLLTGKGLVHLNTKAMTFQLFDRSDGMNFPLESKAIYFDSSTNQILIGGLGGYYAFGPDDVKKNSYEPPLVLTDVSVLNEPVPIGKADTFSLNQTIGFTKEIGLSHKENTISFEFAALNYRSPEKNQYAYKLEGFNDDWIHTDVNRRFATYTNLDPGNYTFMVKGSNNDGVWSNTMASVKLNIAPPPWRTWWAYGLYGLAIVLALLFARRQITYRERLKGKLQLEHMALEKMQEIDALKSRFFTNISHEFRTPLTLIIGPLKRMLGQAKKQGQDKEQKDLDIMYRSSERLLRLTNQLLDLSRLEAGKLSLVKERKEIIKHIKVAIGSFNSLAEQKQIRFKQKTPEFGCIANIDLEKLENIIYNLLSNAFKFTPKNGNVTVEIKLVENSPQNELSIMVKDTGSGIEQEDLDKIFDRFYRSPESVQNEIEGTGIGLALTKELVALMGGTINVESKKNKGTTFYVTLPIEEASITAALVDEIEKNDTHTTAIDADREPSDAINSLPMILVVEDDADLRYYIKECLGSKDYKFVEAKNGKEGFERAKELIPDIILSDLMMPGMDGLAFCNLVKNHEPTNHIPFIMLTAKASEENRIEGLETGADDYITKPFDAKALHLKVKNGIRQQLLLQEKLRKDLLLEPTEKKVRSEHDRFINKLRALVDEYIDDTMLSIDFLSGELAMSRIQLYRKTQALTGLSPSGFVRMIRLKKAAQLLTQQWSNVSDIAFAVGFGSLSYFTKCFKDVYGTTPSDYAKS